MTDLPVYKTIELSRKGRLLTITLNRPDVLNAVNLDLHEELGEVFHWAGMDPDSDVIVLTGAGKGFSAGGDLEHIQKNANNPVLFDREAQVAKKIVFDILDIEKPLICRLNGHAVGLGATIALLCDVIFASDRAKIGDPHIHIGLVAGDGGALIWPERIGLPRAKEYLMTGELITAPKAVEIGLINHAMPLEELDGAVDAFCDKLLNGATKAIRWTKTLLNLELKRKAHALLDVGTAYEGLSARTADHREAVQALIEKRPPVFGKE